MRTPNFVKRRALPGEPASNRRAVSPVMVETLKQITMSDFLGERGSKRSLYRELLKDDYVHDATEELPGKDVLFIQDGEVYKARNVPLYFDGRDSEIRSHTRPVAVGLKAGKKELGLIPEVGTPCLLKQLDDETLIVLNKDGEYGTAEEQVEKVKNAVAAGKVTTVDSKIPGTLSFVGHYRDEQALLAGKVEPDIKVTVDRSFYDGEAFREHFRGRYLYEEGSGSETGGSVPASNNEPTPNNHGYYACELISLAAQTAQDPVVVESRDEPAFSKWSLDSVTHSDPRPPEDQRTITVCMYRCDSPDEQATYSARQFTTGGQKHSFLVNQVRAFLPNLINPAEQEAMKAYSQLHDRRELLAEEAEELSTPGLSM